MSLTQDLLTLARTIYGEARGEPLQGQIAVAQVIMNRNAKGRDYWWNRGRIKSQKGTIQGTCLTPWQFSCWNDDDPNLPKLQMLQIHSDGETWQRIVRTAQTALHGLHRDLVKGATHYHHHSTRPDWSHRHEPVVRIGRHWFYEGIK